MAGVTWKRTGGLVRKLFAILQQEPEGLRAAEALARVADGESLTEYEAGTYKSGVRRFENIIRWATVDLNKAGWLLKRKGRWRFRLHGRFYGRRARLRPFTGAPEDKTSGP